MSNEQLEEVLALLHQRQVKPVVMVAIDGHSAAGKSTLASTIQQHLASVTIIHTDDFYRPLNEEERVSLDARGGYEKYYDWERLEAQVLQPLSQGQRSEYQQYNWTTNALGSWIRMQPSGIILIEGCYAARPELRAYYDVLIWVETPERKRMVRQTARADATSTWLERWDAAERYYIEQFQPQRYADLVISGE
ncbi:MAG: (d)CMP kinase [Caldilineaceae bacterium]|nr:(d)CMP kinase [Caldilineaceae bacterium]